MSKVYLNGDYVPIAEAKVSVLDRGFMFGDGVYEVLPAFGDRIFALDRHMARLERSLSALGIDNPLARAEWHDVLSRVLENYGATGKSVYIQVTRGVAARDHVLRSDVVPTVFVMCTEQRKSEPKPVVAITREDIRWQRCDIKVTSLLANVMLRQEAEDAGAFETILVRDGHLTEGAASNVFVVQDGTVKTPPYSEHLLPGVTRDIVVELLVQASIACEVSPITREELHAADEVWLTSSTRDILLVSKLDDRMIGSGGGGQMWSKASGLYLAYKHDQLSIEAQ